MTCLLPVVYHLTATVFKIYVISENILFICNLKCLMFDIFLDKVCIRKFALLQLLLQIYATFKQKKLNALVLLHHGQENVLFQ